MQMIILGNKKITPNKNVLGSGYTFAKNYSVIVKVLVLHNYNY